MRIYICHSYGRRHGLSDSECELNAYKSIKWGRKVIERGHSPFIPNLWHFIHFDWDGTLPEEMWLTMVSEWIRFCDALFVAEMPKWANSGVQREIDIAKAINLPIYYSLGEIPRG